MDFYGGCIRLMYSVYIQTAAEDERMGKGQGDQDGGSIAHAMTPSAPFAVEECSHQQPEQTSWSDQFGEHIGRSGALGVPTPESKLSFEVVTSMVQGSRRAAAGMAFWIHVHGIRAIIGDHLMLQGCFMCCVVRFFIPHTSLGAALWAVP